MYCSSEQKLAFRKWADIGAFFCVLISLFFLPISTSINALLIVAAILALAGLQFQQHYKRLLTLETAIWTYVLFGLLLVGVFYSSVPMGEAWHAFKKYGFRLFAFVVLPPLFCKPQSRLYIFYTLIAGAVLYSGLDMIDQAGLINLEQLFSKPKPVVLSQFPLSYYCAYAGIAALFLINLNRGKVWIFVFALLYLLFYLFFVNMQRGPLIVFVVMAFMFLCKNYNFKQKAAMLLPALLLVCVVGWFSPVIQKRVGDVFEDLQQYKVGNIRTSIGQRIEFIRYSQLLIKEKPLLGYGTGSFAKEYAKTGGPILEESDNVLGDPHNSYVHIWVQLGIVGVIVFVGWLVSQWRFSINLLANERILLRCFLVAFALSCFNEASFYRSRNANLYITMAVVCLGNAFQPRKKFKRYYKR